MHKLICLGLALLALPVQAAWYLDYESSRLSFISTKNATLSEVGRFLVMHGKVDDKGQARLPLVVDLAVHDQEAADFRKGSVLGGDETESRRLVVQVPGGLDRQGQEGQAEADQLVHAGSLCVRRHLKPAAWEQANSRVSRARAATD